MNDLLAQDNITPSFDESKDYFAELVGENAKFKTPQDLAASKVRSDLYIKDVLRQKDEQAALILEMQRQLDAQASMEDLLDKMESRYSSRETPPKNENVQPNQSTFKPEDIDSLIESRLTQREQKRIEDSNIAASKKMLKEHLGENYLQVVRERIDGLELSESEVNRMAKTSPKTLARVLGLEEQKETLFQSPPTSQRRNETFKPTVQKRTWMHYQNLKKENPRIFLDPKIAVQMHNDHIALGAAFEDGDFHQNQ